MVNLNEKYEKIDVSYLKKYVDELCTAPKNYDSISKKYKIELYISENEKDDYLVPKALYSPVSKNFIVFLSKDCWNSICNPTQEFKKNFYDELSIMLVHEDTHRQQNNGNFSFQNYKNVATNKKDYFSQKVEIDAFARGISEEIMRKINPSSVSELLGYIIHDDKNLEKLSYDSQYDIKIYRTIGGKIWDRFLAKVYDYSVQSL